MGCAGLFRAAPLTDVFAAVGAVELADSKRAQDLGVEEACIDRHAQGVGGDRAPVRDAPTALAAVQFDGSITP